MGITKNKFNYNYKKRTIIIILIVIVNGNNDDSSNNSIGNNDKIINNKNILFSSVFPKSPLKTPLTAFFRGDHGNFY